MPFAAIPLNEDKFKRLFLDKYGSSDFDSQDAFNNYFRGLILEASGNEGSLISFNFNNSVAALRPSIEVFLPVQLSIINQEIQLKLLEKIILFYYLELEVLFTRWNKKHIL